MPERMLEKLEKLEKLEIESDLLRRIQETGSILKKRSSEGGEKWWRR